MQKIKNSGPQPLQSGKWQWVLTVFMTALSALVMLLCNEADSLSFLCAMAASLLLVPVLVLWGLWQALGCWLAVSLFGLWQVESQIALALFMGFGYYPILRGLLEKPKTGFGRFYAKFGYFNLAFVVVFVVLYMILQVEEVVLGIYGAMPLDILVLICLFNVVFFLYDWIVKTTISLCIKTPKKLPKWAEKYKKKPMGKKERKQLRKAQRAEAAAKAPEQTNTNKKK